MVYYLLLFIAPFLFGFAIRFSRQSEKGAFRVTIFFSVLAVVTWAVKYSVPSHGSEGYIQMASMATCLAVGTLAAGLRIRLKNTKNGTVHHDK